MGIYRTELFIYRAVCEASVGIWWDLYHGHLRLIPNERTALRLMLSLLESSRCVGVSCFVSSAL